MDVLNDREVSKGDSVSVTFNLEAEPNMGDNFNYIWTKNGKPLTGSSGTMLTATSITIASADCSDNGVYNVTATNQVGSDSISFRLTVLCKYKFN